MDSQRPDPAVRRRRLLLALGMGASTAGCTEFVGLDDGESQGSAEADSDDLQGTPPLVPTERTVSLETIAEGFTYLTDFAVPEERRDRYFVTDQVGQVYVIEDDSLIADPFLDVSDRLVDVGLEDQGGFDERGLLGIAFHPDFRTNGRFYLRYSAPVDEERQGEFAHVEVLTEYETDESRESADPESHRTVLEIPQPGVIHNSGKIVFGPDEYLYVATGDGGSLFNDRLRELYDTESGGPGQDTTDRLLGGILRIDVDAADQPYGIPDDNPLVDREGHLDEYYAWGFRNPWGMSFDGDHLYVGDVGEWLHESVNYVEKGGNYGWWIKEATHCFNPDAPDDPPDDCPDEARGGEQLRDPIIEYPHDYGDIGVGSAVTTGHVYRGEMFEGLDGTYVFGDWSAVPHGSPRGSLFTAAPAAEDDAVHPYFQDKAVWKISRLVVENDELTENGEFARYVTSVGQDLDGELYVLTSETSAIEGDTGAVHRIVPPDD